MCGYRFARGPSASTGLPPVVYVSSQYFPRETGAKCAESAGSALDVASSSHSTISQAWPPSFPSGRSPAVAQGGGAPRGLNGA